MTRTILYKNIIGITYLLFAGMVVLFVMSSFSKTNSSSETGTLRIVFTNTVNGKPVVLRDSLYSNYFDEQYSISKLKYYVSNLELKHNNETEHVEGYHLINARSDDNSFEISLPAGRYNSFGFLLGVDSIRNCSGAQTDALDPMNDMFWTWNTGYVMFKLEGTSSSSTADLNRIEHHIGGYKGTNNVATKVNFDLTAEQSFEIKKGGKIEMFIETNLDNYWHGKNDIKIAEVAVWMTMGSWAKKIAENFPGLFSIKSIHNIP